MEVIRNERESVKKEGVMGDGWREGIQKQTIVHGIIKHKASHLQPPTCNFNLKQIKGPIQYSSPYEKRDRNLHLFLIVHPRLK